MHKMEKFIPLIVLGFTFLLSGCDYFADKHLVEELKTAKEQEAKIDLLEKQQTTLIRATKGRRSRWPH